MDVAKRCSGDVTLQPRAAHGAGNQLQCQLSVDERQARLQGFLGEIAIVEPAQQCDAVENVIRCAGHLAHWHFVFGDIVSHLR